MATVEDVARWMQEELEKSGELDQADAVHEIEVRFGEEFAYINENGNPAIDRKVLKAFRKLNEDVVVWDRYHLRWRKREPHDPPDSRVVDN